MKVALGVWHLLTLGLSGVGSLLAPWYERLQWHLRNRTATCPARAFHQYRVVSLL